MLPQIAHTSCFQRPDCHLQDVCDRNLMGHKQKVKECRAATPSFLLSLSLPLYTNDMVHSRKPNGVGEERVDWLGILEGGTMDM